jgi:hypothetical protein
MSIFFILLLFVLQANGFIVSAPIWVAAYLLIIIKTLLLIFEIKSKMKGANK